MIGILVELAMSWLIVWLFEKGNLSVLGLRPGRKRLFDFLIFFFVTAACSSLSFLLNMLIAKSRYQLNPELSFGLIAEGTWFVVKSVLFEELIFRGVLLYILIKKFGAVWGILISSLAFGIYHWFSHELWGQPMQMLFELLSSAAIGSVMAWGYAKSRSLYIPVAIHFGWNLVQMVVFSGNTIGGQLFVDALPQQVVTVSWFSYFVLLLLPLLACLLLNSLLLRKYKSPAQRK